MHRVQVSSCSDTINALDGAHIVDYTIGSCAESGQWTAMLRISRCPHGWEALQSISRALIGEDEIHGRLFLLDVEESAAFFLLEVDNDIEAVTRLIVNGVPRPDVGIQVNDDNPTWTDLMEMQDSPDHYRNELHALRNDRTITAWVEPNDQEAETAGGMQRINIDHVQRLTEALADELGYTLITHDDLAELELEAQS